MRNPCRYFKTSPEVIRLAVMMYIRFPLSLRQVEDMLHERGIDPGCHEKNRQRSPPSDRPPAEQSSRKFTSAVTARRERAMANFRSAKPLQKFASIHASIHNHFNQDRHLNRRDIFKQNRSAALAEWRQLAA